MGISRRITSVSVAATANEDVGNNQANRCAAHPAEITAHRRPKKRSGNGSNQRQTVGEIRRVRDDAGGDSNRHPFADGGTASVFNEKGLRAAAEHLGKLLATTTARFMTATAAPMLHFNDRLCALDCTNDTLDGA